MTRRDVPNALTAARLILAGVFVWLLSLYAFPGVNAWALPAAAAVFVAAAATDALDGWLARRWDAVSLFGRIMDPVADKILVLGAFVALAGPAFHEPAADAARQASGVAPWMAIVILARELLVTSIRGVLEAQRIDFSAAWSGKIKMIAQSIGAPLIILLVWAIELGGPARALAGANGVIAWTVALLTAASAAPYALRARALVAAAA